MAFGYAGKILKVNLTTGATTTVDTQPYVDKKFIGGLALAARLYWEDVTPQCKAFDPENAVIFASGPSSGTMGFGSRTTIATKTPEAIPECFGYSCPGGDFSAELKFAGYDAVVVTGKAKQPVYVLIRDAKVEILSAIELWGMGVYATTRELKRLWGWKASSMIIGPAGENMNQGGATIICDLGHAAGEASPGSVMGSKNLKAVVVSGSGKVTVARPQALLDYYEKSCRIGGAEAGPHIVNSIAYEGFEGTNLGLTDKMKAVRPIENVHEWWNWQTSRWSEYYAARDELNAGTVHIKMGGCFSCPTQCQQATMPKALPAGEGSKYPETDIRFTYNLNPPYSYGNQCHEFEYVNTLTQLGYGGMSHGRPGMWENFNQGDVGMSSHAWTTDFQGLRDYVDKGLLTPEDTGLPTIKGQYHKWVTYEFVGPKGWIYKTANRSNKFFEAASMGRLRMLTKFAKEGFGHGTAAQWQEAYDNHVNKPYYQTSQDDSTGNQTALNLIVESTQIRDRANSGMSHITGVSKQLAQLVSSADVAAAPAKQREKGAKLGLWGPKAWDIGSEPRTFEDKAQAAIVMQHVDLDRDSLPGCGWGAYPRVYSIMTADMLREPHGPLAYAAITGKDISYKDYLAQYEVAWTQMRAIHCREGRRREHDTLSEGAWKKTTWTTKAEWNKAMDEYYTLRGWDKTTGVPTRARLTALGLADVADGLAKAGVPVA